MNLPSSQPWITVSETQAPAAPPRPAGAALRWPILFAAATILTTYLAGGFAYALAVMFFFLAHEMGHYVACRCYRVEATLPYYIPAPPPPFFIFGTLGAVIRIKGRIPSRKALFDIGVAGPLAGFVAALPLVVYGVLHASVTPAGRAASGMFNLGDSLLTYGLVSWLRPEAHNMELNVGPVFLAGWLGLLATAMNLFPAGQFDGGHIAYALAPRWHRTVGFASAGFLCALVAVRGLAYHEFSAWSLWAVILVLFGRRHPPLPYWEESIGVGRKLLAVAAALILLLSFMPVPLSLTP